ncbi:hypothetical protein AGMMS49928_29690 [Spirochaetia bacterium]|nr:hypothetical protein AGMMS49928_29690 [Spirochaetia bacterium]
MDNMQAFLSCVRKKLPTITEPHLKNKERDRLTLREVLLDLRGKRRRKGKSRTFQDMAGHTVTERLIENGIVIFRKTLCANGEFTSEYYDGDGIISRKLFFFKSKEVFEMRYSKEGKQISSFYYPTKELWNELMEDGGIPFIDRPFKTQ